MMLIFKQQSKFKSSENEARWNEDWKSQISKICGSSQQKVVKAMPRHKIRSSTALKAGNGRQQSKNIKPNPLAAIKSKVCRCIKANIFGAAVIGLATLLGPGVAAHGLTTEPAETIIAGTDNICTGTEFDGLINEVAKSRHVPCGFLMSASKHLMLLDRSAYSDEVKMRDALIAVAKGYSENMDRTVKQNVSETESRPTLQQATAAVDEGRFQDAGYIFAQLVGRNVAAVREMEEKLNIHRLSAARNMANMGDMANFQADYRQAANHYADAYAMCQVVDPKEAVKYLMKQANSLFLIGNEYDDKQILLEVIGLYREILAEIDESFHSEAESVRESVTQDWASIQNDLGASLHALAKLEPGTAQLNEAVEAYRLSLAVRARERDPLVWAMVQSNLGAALKALGERESGAGRLQDAVGVYRLVLEEFTRERAPLDWAMTQSNLGSVLLTLGERESGTERLQEAVEAYRLALGEFARERVPLKWAGTQNNLGNALSTLGKRESGAARLKEAVEAYRLALEVYTKERAPLQWAIAQYNLGNVLSDLGGLESGTARLKEAVEAYRLALEVYARESAPLDWAMTQNNLGSVLQALGKREKGTARLKEAVEAHRLALKEYTRKKAPLQWAHTHNNLGNVFLTLGEREIGTARLKAAVRAYRLALEVYTRESVPQEWAMTQNNLGVALQILGRSEQGTERLKEAVEAFHLALEVRTRERVPQKWASTQNNLGTVLLIWGARESGTERLEEAVRAYRLALEEVNKESSEYLYNMILENISKAQTMLQFKERMKPPAAPDDSIPLSQNH